MFSSILNTLSNCFKIPELKSRIWFTLIVLAICRLTELVPAPGLDSGPLVKFLDSPEGRASASGGFIGMYSMFTGGGFEKCAVGTLGIMPYISATIILQLLQAVIPSLSKLAREEGGRTKLIQYGRVLTLGLCLVQGLFAAFGWENAGSVFKGFHGDLVIHTLPIWWYRIQTAVIISTGTMLLMWLGEQITDRGIGNGISLIITVNILARLPQAGIGFKDMLHTGSNFNVFHFIMLIALLCAVVAGVVAVTQAERKIPVHYAQRMVGRKTYSGGSSFMPLRVNYSGVMPVIFASAILMFPAMIFNFVGDRFNIPFLNQVGGMFARGASPVYYILYGLMILFFSYFWVATQFNELQISDDMKKSGGYIPGVRPGQATSGYLHRTMSRITLAGAIFLTIIAVIPLIMQQEMGIEQSVAQFFGGTSLLIIVGVMLDTLRQMEAHLLMRHYDGFLKKGRIKGRF